MKTSAARFTQPCDAWQYWTGCRSMPTWVVHQVHFENTDPGSKLKMDLGDDGEATIEDGDWLVKFPDLTVRYFEKKEFEQYFEILPEAGP